MTKINFLLLILSLIFLLSCQEKEDLNTAISSQESSTTVIPEFVIDLQEIDFKSDTLTVQIAEDQVFKIEKTYLAFSLRAILEEYIAENQIDTTGVEVVFECKDGYSPSNTLADIYRAKGYVAFRDVEWIGTGNWEDKEKFAPYYLVWEKDSLRKKGLAWPYGLTKMRLLTTTHLFAEIYPKDAPDRAGGFELFKQNCLKCHSLNKIGGEMGPEFNHPKNITEYWTRAHIIAFVQSPTSFRYSSKMPPIQHLSLNELNQIVDYLEYMKARKLE